MAFFVENLKYREKKKNSPNEDIETAMEKKIPKFAQKKKKNRNRCGAAERVTDITLSG